MQTLAQFVWLINRQGEKQTGRGTGDEETEYQLSIEALKPACFMSFQENRGGFWLFLNPESAPTAHPP